LALNGQTRLVVAHLQYAILTVCRWYPQVCQVIVTPSGLMTSSPRTVLGCPTWDPPDIQSTLVCRMSQDCPRTSLTGSSGQQVTPVCRDVPGLSWDVPHGILRTSSQPQFARMSQDCPGTSHMGSSGHPVNPSLQGCPRTVPGRPSWDPPDI